MFDSPANSECSCILAQQGIASVSKSRSAEAYIANRAAALLY